MSVKLMSTVWDLQTESHTQKLVLLALADNANDESGCWPSIETIAKKCNLSTRAVRKQIDRLEELKLITLEHRFTKEGRQTSNFYRLHLQGGGCTPFRDEGEPSAGGRVHAVHPNHHKEPPKERERRKSLSKAAPAEKEKRQRAAHQAYVEVTGNEARYELHHKLWRAFDDAGYTAVDVCSVIAAKKAWNKQRPDCPKNLSIRKLIGDLSQFDEELARYRKRIIPHQSVPRLSVNLPPVTEFKAGVLRNWAQQNL